MKCFKCTAEMIEGFTTDVTEFGSNLIIIRNVPCFKCVECGEIFYKASVVSQLEKIVETIKNQKQEISVLEYSSLDAA